MEQSRKKQIVCDWQREFPLLKNYTPSILAIKADFVLISLNIACPKWGYDEYVVTMDIYPLWVEESQIRKLSLIMNKVTMNSIRETLHEQYYMEVIDKERERLGKLFTEHISLSNFWECLKNMQREQSYTPHNASDWNRIFSAELATALYFNDQRMKNLIWQQIEYESRYWSEEHISVTIGCSVKVWKEKLFERFSDRNRFMKKIEENSILPNIKRLNKAHIYMDNFDYIKAFRPIGFWNRLHWSLFKK